MGRDCASERVPITLAEGLTRGPPAESPALTPRLARKRPRRDRPLGRWPDGPRKTRP